MSWFVRSTSPDQASELLRDALDDALAHLQASSDEPPVRLVRLRERLTRPPVPSGLRREVQAVLAQMAVDAMVDGEDDTPAAVAEMASAFVNALDASALLDLELVSEISELEGQVPTRVGRGDARRLAREAERIRDVALPARERAQRTRREVQRLVQELAHELAPGLRQATSLDWGLSELSTSLASASEPAAMATVRETLGEQLRTLAKSSAAVRVRMSRALEHTRALQAELDDAHERIAELEAQSERDALTGLYDRGAFDRRLLEAVSSRDGERASDAHELCLVMIDIDHFKQINDTYGHPVGDEVLREVADTIGQVVRGDDVVGRVGGEEFAILLKDVSQDGAFEVVERIRIAVEGRRHHGDAEGLHVTLSAGLAVHAGTENALALYKRADRALYAAKEQGRNRCVLAA